MSQTNGPEPTESPAKKKRGDPAMLIATAVMAALAVLFLAIAYTRGQSLHILGLKAGGQMTLQVLPLLVCAFILAGTVQVLVPSEVIARWVGTESGLRGILVGTLAGAVTPGGPYVTFPVVAALYRAGAGIGTTVAFVTAWSLWAFARLPTEVALLGVRFALIRFACTFFFAPIAGLLAHYLFK